MTGARITIYLPSELIAEIETYRDATSVSRFIRLAVDAYVEPFRPHCKGCSTALNPAWRFCPDCGTVVATLEAVNDG